MNDLTKKLLEEGYTKDNHPDYVKWVDYINEFEYTSEFIYNSTWEAPCGVMRKGYFTSGYGWINGVCWRVENNNYNFHCPYNKDYCDLFHPLLKNINLGSKCSWHLSDKPYDYDNSAEKIKDERDKLIGENLKKRFGTNGMISCACCHINQDTCEPYFKYNPRDCITFSKNGCFNEWCWCTKKERDLTPANIYYDVKTTEEFQYGFIVEPVIRVTKGKKFFDNRKAMTDLDMFLKVYPDEIYDIERMRHSSQLFWAEHHGKKFELEVVNIRIEKRESRDIMQDLQDISEGILVTHKSDEVKKAKEAKKERRKKYQEAKEKKKLKKQSKELKNTIEINQISLFQEGDI